MRLETKTTRSHAEGQAPRVPLITAGFAVSRDSWHSSFRARSASRRGFTLIEIALCLGIIGFALIAIVSSVPTATAIQKRNRAETFINEDAMYWMEALRSGARGLDDLTNFVDEIVVDGVTNTLNNGYGNGADIIGLLSTPSAAVRATVRTISGSAAEQAQATRDFAFKYWLEVTLLPSGAPEVLQDGLWEVSLRLRWPVLRTEPPRSSKTFRAQFNGAPEEDPPNSQRYFFHP
jgi:prepilin-type N-terminal cleavage/methylation domain-containing protein